MKRILTDVIGVFIPIAAYILLLALGSNGLLKVEQINQVVAPLGELAQAILMVFLIVVTYFAASLFITPVKLYYEQKKVAERHNWNDVDFKELNPKQRNLLGWGIRVKNNKLTSIENLSAWLVGIQPDSLEPKRFGYVNFYETDSKPIFSSLDLAEDRETIFIVSNFYEHQEKGELSIKARNSENESEPYLALGTKSVIDIEFRANGFPPKLIRYSLNNKRNWLPELKRYKAK